MKHNPRAILSGLVVLLGLSCTANGKEPTIKPVFPKDFNPPRIEAQIKYLNENSQKIVYGVADSLGYSRDKIKKLTPGEILDLSSKITDFCFEYSHLIVHKVKKEKLTLQQIVGYGESIEDSLINEDFQNVKDTTFLNQYNQIKTQKERIKFFKRYSKNLEKTCDNLTVDELIAKSNGKRDNMGIICRHYADITVEIANFLYSSTGYGAKAFEIGAGNHSFVAAAYEEGKNLVVTFDCPTGKDANEGYNTFKETSIQTNKLKRFYKDIIKGYKKKK